jgi:hypothetical protein
LWISHENLTVDSFLDGIILYHVDMSIEKLNKRDNPNKFVDDLANETLRCINEFLKVLQNQVNDYNNQLDFYIDELLREKYNKEKMIFETMGSLNIPLKKNNSPNTKPITLIPSVKNNIPLPEKDNVGELIERYAIDDKDYVNINNIIYMVSSMMEKAAFTFGKLEEESLRDVLLVALNSHYKNMVSGETFRKRGKTDILIEFKNQGAYIGECKIWHGKSRIYEAINQLLAYCTWRDTKCSLVFYSRNVNFKEVLETIKEYLNNHGNDRIVSYKQEKPNVWECVIKMDENINIRLNLSIYDLYFKENIKD